MKILARHLTADLFNCKNNKLTDIDLIKANLDDALADHNLQVIDSKIQQLSEEHYLLMAILPDGHITLHIYADLKYVALDIFLCHEDAEPDKISKEIRNFFKPDKTKTTVLKRGNFGNAKDIKPKVKTKVAPLRKIHNTGAKVIRILARRNHQ
ncbi:S-adenosylmethionine decarboxylase family protein [Selenomonas ruminis]|uniref:S-adenosylmethionine decarboxylase proenzyme n=1 Tax=Selenomonas ruminis TaxID=2593411 RepID=A0A5D6W401_9FIRM|nr:S-adenosylmethionine decarboxylase [Selenomonas sp. mPRGC5]TYZ21719.1 S-adenosylmethionine decarboxylase proenzyme [Selenomonas sp. mPRGC5]